MVKHKARLAYKLLQYMWPNEWDYWVPAKPGEWVAEPGYLDFYECPNPALEGSFVTRGTMLTTSTQVIPEFLKCLQSQSANPGPADGNLIFVGRYYEPGGNPRQDYKRIWLYPRNFTDPRPEWPDPYLQPERAPIYLPLPLPTFTPFPEELPIQQPAPFPLPVPYPLVPHVPDSPWPQGRQTQQPSAPVPGRFVPRQDPYAGPSVEFGPDYNRPGPPHTWTPAPPGTKERKHPYSPINDALKSVIDDVLGPITEFNDIVDAIYKALPKGLCPAKTIQAKADCIYRHANEIDLNEAIQNIILNHFEDKVIGAVGAKVKSQGHKRPTQLRGIGWSVGPAI